MPEDSSPPGVRLTLMRGIKLSFKISKLIFFNPLVLLMTYRKIYLIIGLKTMVLDSPAASKDERILIVETELGILKIISPW